VCVCVCVCVPWMTSFSKQSLLFRMTRSKHLSVLVLTSANKLFLMPAFSRTQSFVFLAVHGALSNWRYLSFQLPQLISSFIGFIVPGFRNHKLIPATAEFLVVIFLLRLLCCDCAIPLLMNAVLTPRPLFSLARISLLQSASTVITIWTLLNHFLTLTA